MNDRAYSDGGVYDDGQPAEPFGTEPMVEPGHVPTCPYCGMNDTASAVSHPTARWFCSCGSLFTGTDSEWRRLARHRRKTIERRAGSWEPVKPQKKPVRHLGEKQSEPDLG